MDSWTAKCKNKFRQPNKVKLINQLINNPLGLNQFSLAAGKGIFHFSK